MWQAGNGVKERRRGPAADFLWIWKAARRRSFQALSTKVVVMVPNFLRVLMRRELAIGERHGLFLVFSRAVSSKEAIRLVV